MTDRKVPLGVPFIILFIGLIGLYRVMSSSQFESYRTVDVIQLVASGACFGAAFVALIAMLLRRRT